MVRRTTWILLLIFGGLVLFAWLFQRYQSNKAAAITATPTTAPTEQNLYDLTDSQVVEITIADSKGNSIDFTREAGFTTWVIKGLPAEQVDSFQIESVSAQLLSIQALNTLTQDPPMDAIGLTNPAYSITIVTSDGKQIVTHVGSLSPIGTGYYLRVDSGPVVIVDSVTMDGILHLLKEPPIMATATPVIKGIETGTPIAPIPQATPTP